jgi:ribonuclease D
MGALEVTGIPAPPFVETLDAQPVADAARAAGVIGFDTEFMREKTYRARLCLAQVSVGDDVWLLDATGGVDLKPIAELLADKDVEVLIHAGRQDLEIFYEAHGTIPRRIFDVQSAAAFAGYGASLSYGRLVEGVLEVKLEKGESYTDWCRRPLTESQKRYAADDVRYLGLLKRRLTERLDSMGRLAWFEEEMKALEDESSYRIDPDFLWQKVSGRGSLHPRATAVLRELARWREELAESRDLPRGWIVKDATLVEIARKSPTTMEDLRRIRGLNRREAEKSAKEILAAIQTGRSGRPVARAKAPSKSIQARARMVSGLADALVRARCEEARLATELVATRGELEDLLTDAFNGRVDESKYRLLQGWRRELAGDAVLELARGRLGVKVIPDPPYIKEVRVDG